MQQALPAIFLKALRRLRGAVLFRGLRSSSSWGFPFWRLGLTVQSSRPAFGGRLTFGVSSQMNRSGKLSVLQAAIVAAVALIYAAMLYFRAATASLDNHYQPGISTLQNWFMPGALLFALTLVAVAFRSVLAAQVAVFTNLSAIVICAFLLIFVISHPGNPNSWVFPQHRTLQTTIHTALFSPNFSNRSKGSIIGSAVVASCFLGISCLVLRRRKLTIHSSRPPQAAAA